jgi:hypothetical protein
MSGYYDETGAHICDCGEPTVYQMFSGGTELYCKACECQGRYPEGDGGPRARLLAEPDGALRLRRMMYEEIARRKSRAASSTTEDTK